MAHLPNRPLTFLYPSFSKAQICVRSLSTSAVTRAAGGHGFAMKKKPYVRIHYRDPPPLTPYPTLNQAFFREHPPQLELPTFEPDAIVDGKVVRSAMVYPKRAIQAFKTFGVPRNVEREHASFYKPISIVRDSTVQLLAQLDEMGAVVRTEAAPNGLILHGPTGCGKSTLLLQAVSHCLEKGWIVIYTPRGTDLVNSSSSYAYDSRTKLFNQAPIARKTLKNLLAVNGDLLETILVDQNCLYGEKGQTYAAGGTLKRLVEIGLEDETDPMVVLSLVMEQLGRQEKVPVVWAVDDYQVLYCTSLYRDPQFYPVEAYHLSMPRLILEYAIGKKKLARGLILGALGPLHTRFAAPVPLREAIGAEQTWTQTVAGPYAERTKEHLHYSAGLKGFPVSPRLKVKEAMMLCQAWNDGQVLHTRISDDFFFAKYTEASGNAREFSRALTGTMQ